jgi:alpha-tubulin suppressor-like RCC1 family protein
MASSPSSSDNKTFTITPSPKTFYSTTYKIRVTTAAEDSAGNNIAQYTQTYGFDTSITFPITAGSAHTCYMLDNGSVKCWGSNTYGQLGLGNTTDSPNPSVVDLGSGIKAKAIAAGGNHTCAILDNSSIKCWGYNASGQLGLGNTNSLGDAGSEMGDNLDTVDLGSGITATAIAAGGNHTCAIIDNSSIKCWGKNSSGQLGLGSTDNLGDGGSEMGDDLDTVDLGSGRTAKGIAAGGNHTCAILDNSAIKCWGLNQNGQLGLGNANNQGDAGSEMGDNLDALDLGTDRIATAISAGGSHTCAILNNSSIYCWGRSNEGQMGRGGKAGDTQQVGDATNEMGDRLEVIELGTGRTATAIAAGDHHNCAILDNSSIKCWGANASGQLGLGNTENRGDLDISANSEMGDSLPTLDLGTGRTARGIVAGDNQTCAILDNASIKCWGENTSGQLGLGNTTNQGVNPNQMGDTLLVIDL